MAKEEVKTQENEKVEVKETSDGRVFNFTRHNFVVVAKNRKEAEEALENHLKKNKEAK